VPPAEQHAAGAAAEIPAAQRRGWLTAILGAACALRAFRLDWGLPDFIFNDTRIHFVQAAARATANDDWVLIRFVHPPLFPYVLSVATWIWAAATGTEIHTVGPQAKHDLAAIVMIGRCLTVALAAALVGATYLLGRRLLGSRVGLWAAAFVALSPLQIIESHRINVDTPMLLIAVLSAHQAVVALQERHRGRLLVAFALAALAGGTKYTGLYAGTMPIWVALRWPDVSWAQRLRLTLTGGLVSLATFLIALSPVLLNWAVFVRNLQEVFYIGLFHGAPGQNLVGDSWVYAPYLYLTVVGLPFMVGWAVFLAAVAGLITLAVRRHPALSLIGGAALPFFALQGLAETATARYYLPLLPYLAISAGAFVDWIRRATPVLGNAVAAIIVGYSAILACSQVNRIGGAPQLATGAVLEGLAEAKRSTGISLRAVHQPKLVIAYPYWASSIYDALYPHIAPGRNRHLVYLPSTFRFPGDALDPAEALREDRKWSNQHGIDVVVVTSRWEHLAARKSFQPREEQFYRNLTTGSLGFRQATHEETSYVTRSWYEWADPTLDTIWTAGIGGYKLYVRDDLMPALRTPSPR
jgi:4-amino-4-deoxy-L-arabinose transferase-like glycosyltransferase